jgi:secretion/DNA translocation related TadE-like protein
VLALSAVLALIGAASVLVGAAVVARHRATAAADLAALAAAGRAVLGDAGACSVAREMAAANAAVLTDCALGGGGVAEVTVTVGVQLGRLGLHTATASARAGPAPP